MNRAVTILSLGVLCVIAVAEPPHPALLPPDGRSHRGDKLVGHTLKGSEDLLALGKLYQDAKRSELRQEYFLRLLDYYWFSEQRLIGMKRSDIEKVFGAGRPAPVRDHRDPAATRFSWSGGRDAVLVWFEKDFATGAFYVMGY